MGTTLNKLEYLDETKGQIKTALNQFNAGITDETTFRDYVDKINNIYNNWEKVTGEGTDITLNNTKKGKLYFEDNKVCLGDTEQNGTPTPTTPIPINTVTGEQELTIRGKNKLKINDVTLTSNGVTLTVQDNYFILNGTNNGTESVFQLSNYITPFKTNSNTKLKAFQISGTASGNLLNTFFRTYSNWANQVNINFTQTTMSSYSAELTYNNCMLALAGGTYTDYKIGIMVTDNLTSDDTFENYITPITKTLNLGNIELCKIGTYRDYIYKNLSNGKWIKYNAIIKRTLNGTESINTDNSYIASGRFNINQYTDAKYGSQATPNIMSNYYRPNFAIENGAIFVSGVSPDICIIDTRYQNNLNGFKQYLSENTPIIYYVLATATYTEITDTSLISQLEEIYNIMSLNGTTKIEVTGDLPMILKVGALKGGVVNE